MAITPTRRDALLHACALSGASALPMIAQRANAAAPQSAPATPPDFNPVCLADYETLARDRTPRMAYEYVCGGAGNETTMRWNLEAYDRIKLRPRILVDVSKLDTRITLFGQELAFPILLAPTAFHRMVHPEGELATAKGAGAAKATMVVSSASTTSIEEIAAVAQRPLWFQLYVQRDRPFNKELVKRVEDAGCKALCVTVDAPVDGVRDRQARIKFKLPPGMERVNLRGVKLPEVPDKNKPREEQVYSERLDPTLTWKEIEWLISFARVPVLLKGVLTGEEADRGIKAGAAGIMVSNHGGRGLDTVPATIEALPEVVEKVAGRVPVIVDGGIRRGTDVLKALALGASATMIGRPYLFGLGCAGAEGVTRIINILRAEFESAMALMGRPTIKSIDRTVLW